MSRSFTILLGVFLFVLLCTAVPESSNARSKINGQILYVPVYSDIYYGNRDATFNLTTTISVRNTSRTDSFRILRVDYYDTNGKLIKSFLKEAIEVNPLQSLKYVIRLDDDAGGSGANMIVVWEADSAIDAPIVESISLGFSASLGFSFLTQAVEIE